MKPDLNYEGTPLVENHMSADQEEVFRRYTEVIGHPVARPDEPQNLQQPDIRQPIVATTSYGSIAGAVVAVPSYAIQPKP